MSQSGTLWAAVISFRRPLRRQEARAWQDLPFTSKYTPGLHRYQILPVGDRDMCAQTLAYGRYTDLNPQLHDHRPNVLPGGT